MTWPSVNWASGSVPSRDDDDPSEQITRASFSGSKFALLNSGRPFVSDMTPSSRRLCADCTKDHLRATIVQGVGRYRLNLRLDPLPMTGQLGVMGGTSEW